MKNIIKIILVFVISTALFGGGLNYASAEEIDKGKNVLDTPSTGQKGKVNNDYLKKFEGENDFATSQGGEEGAKNLLVRIAKDIKNIFYIIAGAFLMILVVRLLFGDNTDEEVGKFKKGIIWTTIGIMVMQGAFAFVGTLYNRDINQSLAFSFIENIINPMIGLIEVLASVFFLGIAIFAFFRIIVANGDEEKIKQGKMSIAYAIIGFILIRIAKIIVEGVYGKLDCQTDVGGVLDMDIQQECLQKGDVQGLAGVFMHIINWMNGFVGLIVVILIIYTGFRVITSSGDEEVLKKAKRTLIYIAIGLVILATNYLILTFFILPEVQI